LTALTVNFQLRKRGRRSTGVLVAVALSSLKVGVAWRCGVVEFRRLRKGGMWVLRTPRKIAKQGFNGEVYLGYVGEAKAEVLLELTQQQLRWRWEAFMEHHEEQDENLKLYWIRVLKKSEAWRLLRSKKIRSSAELQKISYDADSWVGVWTRSYYPLLKRMTFDLGVVDPNHEESRRVFITRVVPRWASKAGVPVKAAVMAFGYALNRYAGGYSPQAVRLFMPPLDELNTEDEFNRTALEVERRLVRVPGLQRWRVRNMWLYRSFLWWLRESLHLPYTIGDLWDQLHGKYPFIDEDTHMRS
jgi:hypothetical protein